MLREVSKRNADGEIGAIIERKRSGHKQVVNTWFNKARFRQPWVFNRFDIFIRAVTFVQHERVIVWKGKIERQNAYWVLAPKVPPVGHFLRYGEAYFWFQKK